MAVTSLNFDSAGSGRRVDFGSAASLDDMTAGGKFWAAFWLTRTSAASNQYMASKVSAVANSGWDILASSSIEGDIRVIVRRGAGSPAWTDYTSTGSALALNTKTFVCVVFNDAAGTGARWKVYTGTQYVLAASIAMTVNQEGAGNTINTDAAANLIVGNHTTALNLPFRGTIQRVGCGTFSTTPTLRQIQALQMQTAWSNASLGTVALRCEFASGGGTQTDTSGNSNSGTITSATDSTDYKLWTTLALTDSNVFFSPYNWYSDGAGALGANNIKGSSTYALSNTPGAYCKFKLTIASGDPGSIVLAFNTDVLSADTAANAPTVAVSIDDAPYTTTLLVYDSSSSTQFVILQSSAFSVGNHTIRLDFKSIGLASAIDRWTTPGYSVKLAGIQVDPSAATASQTLGTKNAIFFGDSLWEAAAVAGTQGSTTTLNADNDATYSAARFIALSRDAEYGIIAFGGQGFDKGISGVTAASTNPSLYNSTAGNQSWDKYFSGQSRLVSTLLSPVPDYAFVQSGVNDGSLVAATVTSLINALRTACSSSTWLFVFAQATGTYASVLSAGVAAATQQYRTKYLASPVYIVPGTASVWSNDASGGGQHLNIRGQYRNTGEMSTLTTAQLDAQPIGQARIVTNIGTY
jgi:hypothetical protein